MKIRMRTTAAGPDRNLVAGAVYELPDSVARVLVNAGAAEVADRPQLVKPIEAAVRVAPERAVMPKASPRRGR